MENISVQNSPSTLHDQSNYKHNKYAASYQIIQVLRLITKSGLMFHA